VLRGAWRQRPCKQPSAGGKQCKAHAAPAGAARVIHEIVVQRLVPRVGDEVGERQLVGEDLLRAGSTRQRAKCTEAATRRRAHQSRS
jgi:hypothetical protein